MPRIRQIKHDFYLDEELAGCSRDARLLFPGLWILADRAGRLEDRPARIKVQVFPYDDDIGTAEVDKLLTELSKHFILRYECKGKRLIQIVNFCKHQHCHVREPQSEIPEPIQVKKTKKARCKPGASPVQEPVENPSGPAASGVLSNGVLSIEEPQTGASPVSRAAPSEVLFDDFWKNYPRKVGRQEAVKAWKKIKPDANLLNQILAALEWQRKTWRDPEYIPYPASWLNGRRWEDEKLAISNNGGSQKRGDDITEVFDRVREKLHGGSGKMG